MPQIIQNSKTLTSCANLTCFRNGKNTHMRYCTGCKLAPYCGPECQRMDWPMHKKMCASLRIEQDRVEQAAVAGQVLHGVNVAVVSSKFRRWHVAALPIIERCVIAAMDLVNHPDRCFTHAVLITVSSNLTPTNSTTNSTSNTTSNSTTNSTNSNSTSPKTTSGGKKKPKKKTDAPEDIIKQFSVRYAYICRIDEMPGGHDLESARDTILAGVKQVRRANEGPSTATTLETAKTDDDTPGLEEGTGAETQPESQPENLTSPDAQSQTQNQTSTPAPAYSPYGLAFAVVRFPEMQYKQLSVVVLPKKFDPKKRPKLDHADWVDELKERIRNGRV